MTRYAWIDRLGQPLKNRPGKQHGQPQGRRSRPCLEALEARTLLSGNIYLVNQTGDVGTGSGLSGDIRYCISQADLSANAGSTITFESSVLGGKTITLTHGQLAITDNMTITGLGANSLTISGDKLSRVLEVNSTTAKVTISGLTHLRRLCLLWRRHLQLRQPDGQRQQPVRQHRLLRRGHRKLWGQPDGQRQPPVRKLRQRLRRRHLRSRR
jgi:hypothetical protein